MNWESDVNRYAGFLKLKDHTTTVKGIEFCERVLASIREKYPNQKKIFDTMDRE